MSLFFKRIESYEWNISSIFIGFYGFGRVYFSGALCSGTLAFHLRVTCLAVCDLKEKYQKLFESELLRLEKMNCSIYFQEIKLSPEFRGCSPLKEERKTLYGSLKLKYDLLGSIGLDKADVLCSKQAESEPCRGFGYQKVGPLDLLMHRGFCNETSSFLLKRGVYVDVGASSLQGVLEYQEDQYLMSSFQVKDVEGNLHHFLLTGVFDGQSGKGASTFMKDNLTKMIESSLEDITPILRSFK